MSKYVIIDLEMCRIPKRDYIGEKPLKSELIQIGAVLLNSSLEIVDEFESFVSPDYGIIDRKIERLTGIRTSDVKDAPKFEEAINKFYDWLPKDAILIDWSDSDENQIRNELEFKNIAIPEPGFSFGNWIDCQKKFSEKMHTEKVYRLSEALSITDINYDLGAHNALVDAKNTAMLFAKMEREPELVLSPYYSNYMSEDICTGLLGNYSYSV